MVRLRRYRFARVQQELQAEGYCGAVLFDPINVRYATDSRNMSVWLLHNAARYCFVPAQGAATLFDFHGCAHLSRGLETIAEVRPAIGSYFFSAGSRADEQAKRWAVEIADLARAAGGKRPKIAIDHVDLPGMHYLSEEGVELGDAQPVLEHARAIKSAEEIACMARAIAVCEAGILAMREQLRPGITENALWAVLHEANIRMGGEWIETRLLASGPRTNPWFQECSDRVVRSGDLVGFDTDLIGPFGYCADISRTFLCGTRRATDEQRDLYALAIEQIAFNLAQLVPGITLSEYSERCWKIPRRFASNRYSCVAHGVGMCDEWPAIYHADQLAQWGYAGTIAPGMTLCVESYIGAWNGGQGVKLEQQVLVTETGYRLLSQFPLEERLAG